MKAGHLRGFAVRRRVGGAAGAVVGDDPVELSEQADPAREGGSAAGGHDLSLDGLTVDLKVDRDPEPARVDGARPVAACIDRG